MAPDTPTLRPVSALSLTHRDGNGLEYGDWVLPPPSWPSSRTCSAPLSAAAVCPSSPCPSVDLPKISGTSLNKGAYQRRSRGLE